MKHVPGNVSSATGAIKNGTHRNFAPRGKERTNLSKTGLRRAIERRGEMDEYETFKSCKCMVDASVSVPLVAEMTP